MLNYVPGSFWQIKHLIRSELPSVRIAYINVYTLRIKGEHLQFYSAFRCPSTLYYSSWKEGHMKPCSRKIQTSLEIKQIGTSINCDHTQSLSNGPEISFLFKSLDKGIWSQLNYKHPWLPVLLFLLLFRASPLYTRFNTFAIFVIL